MPSPQVPSWVEALITMTAVQHNPALGIMAIMPISA
jgi:hypothetical protein